MPHALLIDGENLSSAHAPAILAAVPADTPIRRVYGDTTRLNGWLSVPGLCAIHAAPGRNAADILLAVHAVHMACTGLADHFVIATSDGGLVHLVQHLRETGQRVIVMGEDKANPALRAMAHQFNCLPPAPVKPSAAPPAKAALPPCDVIARQVALAGEGGLAVADLSKWLQKEHPRDLALWLGAPGPRSFLERHPDRFIVTRAGLQAMVRLSPQNCDSRAQG